jgi:hypothetical protein
MTQIFAFLSLLHRLLPYLPRIVPFRHENTFMQYQGISGQCGATDSAKMTLVS